jgi:hypothetical protein
MGRFRKKLKAQNLMLLSLSGKFLVSKETNDSKIFLVAFQNHPELRKRD